MASVEELNKAIEIISSHCESFDNCEENYCPFIVNCPIKGEIEPPSSWLNVCEEDEK